MNKNTFYDNDRQQIENVEEYSQYVDKIVDTKSVSFFIKCAPSDVQKLVMELLQVPGMSFDEVIDVFEFKSIKKTAKNIGGSDNVPF
tara:strand:- start:13038 stop:13298 length:261 start_codon:yes stop_codon:yes gene_type:complete